MKKPQFMKRVLACSLVLSMAALEGVPAMTVEMQRQGSVKEAAVEKYAEGEAAVKPSITQPTITTSEYSSYVMFRLTYSGGYYTELSVKASNTNKVVYTNSSYESRDYIDSDYFNSALAPNVTYTFTLKPYTYDEDYNKVYGDVKTVTWKAPAAETVKNLAVKEMTSSGFEFSHSDVSENTTIYYEYSTNKAFNSNTAEVNSFYSKYLSYEDLIPGVTYYVRAYANRCGMKGYSNVVTVKAPVGDVTSIQTEIANTSITLKMRTGYGTSTGYQIARKEGKKYKDLITTTDATYKDAGLQKNTKYTYRVRAYYYNVKTKKMTYGSYEYITVETGTAALNLKAKATGKNVVKLTWKKISDASGYDVYRYVGTSNSNTYKSGENNSFSKYELVKSLGKKKTSYTDKKLVSGETYEYRVKAYKTVNGKKVYFTENYAYATTKFSFDSIKIDKQAQNPKNGKVSVTWYPVPTAKGYLIEKYDDTKGDWVTQKNIKKAKTTSYTFPAASLGKNVEYRIRAYSGKKYSNAAYVDVEGHIAAVTGVKAKSTSNGIYVSWKPVSGASYYRVYRTTNSGATYDADTKTYNYDSGSSVYARVFKSVTGTVSSYYTLGSSSTKMEENYEAEEKLCYNGYSSRIVGTSVTDYSYTAHNLVYNNGKVVRDDTDVYGPQSDVTYYYYVVAYRDVKDAKGNITATAQSYGYSKAASAAMAGSAAVKAPSIKTKAGSKKVTISYKKVKNAKKYYIYRSDSKKGAFKLVGTTTKTKFTDKKLTSKKTYRYKVKAVSQNSLGADTYSKFSKIKSVKVK